MVTCPHCFSTLGNGSGDLAGPYEVTIHHIQLLNELVRDRQLVPKKPAGNGSATEHVTYDDPCYPGRLNKVYTPRREPIGATGLTLTKIPGNSNRSLRSGAGGARMWMEEKTGERIILERTDEDLATGADTIVTGCPFCRVMLTDGPTARQNTPTHTPRPDVTDGAVLDVAQMLPPRLKGEG